MRVGADTARTFAGPVLVGSRSIGAELEVAENGLRKLDRALRREGEGAILFSGSEHVFTRYSAALDAHWARKGEV